MRRAELVALGLLLLTYLALGVLFAVRTPAWQAPDEPAHVNYIRQLVAGQLPVIAPGDWDQAYLGEIVGAEFAPAYPVAGLTYEDWQPPLYYLLQAPVYVLSNGALTAMRLLSVALGAGVVALAWVAGRAVFGRAAPALAVAAFVAFLPQHLAILASVNNDSLAELLIAAALALLFVPWPERPPRRRLLALGLLLGAGFLTKGTAYLLAPVVALFLAARYWRQWRPLARALALVFAPAILLGLLWWGRNAAVYGGLDVLARGAHDAVVVGQPRTAEWVAQYGLGGTAARFVRTTFNSFWGQFGWMAAPLPDWMYGPLLALALMALIGLLLAAVRRPSSVLAREADHRPQATGHRRRQVLVLALTFLLTLGLHVTYNLTFVQHQGRYLFPALIPIAVGFAAGLGYWLRAFVARFGKSPYTGEWLLPLGLAGLLIAIDLFTLWRILPGLAPG